MIPTYPFFFGLFSLFPRLQSHSSVAYWCPKASDRSLNYLYHLDRLISIFSFQIMISFSENLLQHIPVEFCIIYHQDFLLFSPYLFIPLHPCGFSDAPNTWSKTASRAALLNVTSSLFLPSSSHILLLLFPLLPVSPAALRFYLSKVLSTHD